MGLPDVVEVKLETFLRLTQYRSSSQSTAPHFSLCAFIFGIHFPHSLAYAHLLILCQAKPLLWGSLPAPDLCFLTLALTLWLSSYLVLLWC